MSIPEKDWKLFRKLQSELTAKACVLVFMQVNNISSARAGKEHQSYLDLYRLIKTEDAKIAEMFSEETQEFVNSILNLS